MRSYIYRYISCIGCLSFFFFEGSAQQTEKPEEKAAHHFQHGEYKEALDLWYALIRNGYSGAGIYYNVGQAESMMQNTADAIYALEVAQRFQPMDHEIRLALQQERKKIENGTLPLRTFFLVQWLKGLLALFRPGYWALFGLAFVLLSVILFLKEQKMNRLPRVFHGSVKVIAAISGLVFIAVGWLSYLQLYRQDEAIVFMDCPFHQAPSEESPQVRILYPGEKAMIKDQIGEWYHISLLNLDEGWVKGEYLKPIVITGF